MASSRGYLDFIIDQLSGLEGVTSRAMMGEYLIYVHGRLVGGIYDDRLLVKITPSALDLLPGAEKELPYPGAKEMLLVDRVDDSAFLCALLERIAGEVPASGKKK